MRISDWSSDVCSSDLLTLTPRRDLAMIAVQGPNARNKLWEVRPDWEAETHALSVFTGAFVDDDILVARTGYTGEDGFEIVLPAEQVETLWRDLADNGVKACGLGARDTLRLEAGRSLYGQEMDEQVDPLVSGLAWTVSMKDPGRSEEHTSELQSLMRISYAVFCLKK